MVWRLYVVDGADQRKHFVLPAVGKVSIGRSERHAHIVLHDLYVGRVHCEVEVEGAQVKVRSLPEGPTGFQINGVRIFEQEELRPGDVLRIGNSHLRLESHNPEDFPEEEDEPALEAEPIEPRKLPTLPLERLGELSGETLSHYQLGEVLGQGHYGVVFRAKHSKSGHEVALKVLSPEFPQTTAEMQTFVRALKSLLLLKHPNLVTLYNAGKTGPYCWLALEYVEGESLAEVLRAPDARRRSHWKPALRMGIHLARALVFLREHRLVHGNITPANVLLGQDEMGRGKEIKLGDLMLNRALEGSAIQEARLEAKLEAELGYLSPEVARGATADGLTDLYGLGAVVYARLTGGPPFQGKTPAETVELITTSVPRKPIDIHRNIPEELSTLVMLLLARHPEERLQTPEEVLASLEDLAENEEIEG